MKDKLYKTYKTVKYYRGRSFLVSFLLLAVIGTALVVPYRYVTEAVRAYQSKDSSEDTSVVEEELTIDEE